MVRNLATAPRFENTARPSRALEATTCGACRSGARILAGACVHHRRLAVSALLTLVVFVLLATLQLRTQPSIGAAIPHREAGAPAVAVTAPSALGNTPQGEPAPSTASPRYDIPGWDSIRRTPAANDVAAMEVSERLASAPQNPLIPVVLGLLVPVLGWVGLPLALRWVSTWEEAPKRGHDRRRVSLLSALHDMATEGRHDRTPSAHAAEGCRTGDRAIRPSSCVATAEPSQLHVQLGDLAVDDAVTSVNRAMDRHRKGSTKDQTCATETAA